MRVLRGMINTGSLSLQVKDGQGKAVGIKGQVREGQVKYGFKYIFYQGRVSRYGFPGPGLGPARGPHRLGVTRVSRLLECPGY